MLTKDKMLTLKALLGQNQVLPDKCLAWNIMIGEYRHIADDCR